MKARVIVYVSTLVVILAGAFGLSQEVGRGKAPPKSDGCCLDQYVDER
jgi:hypothetical protein